MNTTLLCTFLPQEWVRDTAYPVMREKRPNQWLVTVTEEVMEELTPHSYESDQLRHEPTAPRWVKNWDGPFEVDYEEVGEGYILEGASSPNDGEEWLVPFANIQSSYALAMQSAGVSQELIAEIQLTVQDYAANNLGDD